MDENKKDMLQEMGNLGFIDQVIDGMRSIGENLKVQGLLDDAFYMATRGLTNVFLNLGTKFTIDGRVQGAGDLIANRGIIFTTIASNPMDIIIMTQVAAKKMQFVISQEMIETPVLKSMFKAFGVICNLETFSSGKLDDEIFNLLKKERKILSVIVDDKLPQEKKIRIYEKLMFISRDGFAPIVPVIIKGSEGLKPGGEVVLQLDDRIGVNQATTQDQLNAMAKDLIDKLTS